MYATPLRYVSAPRMWEPATGPGAEPAIRIGRRRLALAEIVAVREEHVIDSDTGGLMLMATAFMVAAIFLVVLVLDFYWRTRFLIGAGIFAALAFASLSELPGLRPIRFTRLAIETATGEQLFTTVDAADAAALRLAIETRERLAA
ncbi:MAG: hypothetical protein NW216_12790 [Hyphomicrobium sp.]|nr:hypothetical protein [Hyphomicrobium sp.]